MLPADCYSPRCLDQAISALTGALLKKNSATEQQLTHCYQRETERERLGGKCAVEAVGLFARAGEPLPLNELTKFNAEVSTTDYSVEKINKWIEQKTNGLITDAISELSVDSVATLVTTLYFKDTWAYPFDPASTKPVEFQRTADDTPIEIPMMKQFLEGFELVESDGLRCLTMPYNTPGYNFRIYLPSKGVVSRKWFQERMPLVARLRNEETERYNVNLLLPKFEASSDINLRLVLEKLGVTELFNFTGDWNFHQNLRISQFLQKVKIIVDEQGTEAAAATVAEIEEECYEEDLYPTTDFHCTRPFLYEVTYYNDVLFRGFYQGT